MNRVTLTGLTGVVQWGYSTAATVGPWSLSAEPTGGTLTATVVGSDAFKVSQQPLTFVVFRSTGASWRWPIQSLQIDGPTLTAQVGPPEE